MLGARNFGALLVLLVAVAIALNLLNVSRESAFLSPEQIEDYRKDGIVVVDSLLTDQELKEVTSELMSRVDNREEGVRPEDLLNLHHHDSYILNLTKHPNFLSAASQLLESPKLRLFASRILCKLPGNSIEIPWHQDSNYWPLEPMKVASLWLALDDVTIENGAMDMFPFSTLPQSRGQNMGKVEGEEVGADFFIKVDPASLPPTSDARKMTLKRGQAEFHDAYILHHSDENRSNNRRCAFIARYLPDYVTIQPGSWRKMFPEDYPLVNLN